MRRGPKPAKSKEAKRSVARKSPKDKGARVRDLEKRLAEALRDKAEALEQFQIRDRDLAEAQEQQTATSEILRVISSSPTNVQPMLDAIVQSAVRLCDSRISVVYLFDGRQIVQAAHHGFSAEALVAERRNWPRPATRDTMTGQAILDRQIIHVQDAETDGDVPPLTREAARAVGYHSIICVPMLRQGECIGSINAARVRSPFTERQIELLKTFADQAVIAIENVRLFNETKEALEQQTATSEILEVISQSPTDVQPVFEAIAASAVRLCGAVNGAVFRFDGELIHIAAYHNISGDQLGPWRRQYPATLESRVVTARAILSRAAVQVEDLTNDPWLAHTPVAQAGYRTVLSVPMMRDGLPIGAVNVVRMEVRPFSDNQIALLKTFADQAVIAIENVRLFTELQARNAALAESLAQQTAAAEILRVISESPTDYQPVFDTIVRNAVGVCAAHDAVLALAEGEDLIIRAQHGPIGGPPSACVIRCATQ
jgi:two-component system, NtrC family, sensor kinase